MSTDKLRQLLRHTDLLAAVGVVVVVTMLVVPLPPMILDLLITLNISVRADDRRRDYVLRQGARVRVLPDPAAADDDVPAGNQRVGGRVWCSPPATREAW